MESRRRLARPIRLRGRALFAGGPASVSIFPGAAERGWRWAVGAGPFEALKPEQRLAAGRRSTLAGRARADTCEHLLAALLLADIDDCDIRFHEGEAPILDGSAEPWLRAIRHAGVLGHHGTHSLRIGVRWAGRAVSWMADQAPTKSGLSAGDKLTGSQIGSARTFIQQGEGSGLQKDGVFPGARPGCALVLAEKGNSALYGGRPRLLNEPLCHKLLDVLGDLAPWRAQGRLQGELWLDNPGHASNGPAIAAALGDGRLTFAP